MEGVKGLNGTVQPAQRVRETKPSMAAGESWGRAPRSERADAGDNRREYPAFTSK